MYKYPYTRSCLVLYTGRECGVGVDRPISQVNECSTSSLVDVRTLIVYDDDVAYATDKNK